MDTGKLKHFYSSLVDEIDWDNYTNSEEEIIDSNDALPDQWKLSEVLYCKAQHVIETLNELAQLPGADIDQIASSVRTVNMFAGLVEALSEQEEFLLDGGQQ